MTGAAADPASKNTVIPATESVVEDKAAMPDSKVEERAATSPKVPAVSANAKGIAIAIGTAAVSV